MTDLIWLMIVGLVVAGMWIHAKYFW